MSGYDIKQFFEELKRRCAPDLIFTHYRDDRHQDHRLISDLTWNTYRDHLILEYEIPKYDGDLGSPNVLRAAGRGHLPAQGPVDHRAVPDAAESSLVHRRHLSFAAAIEGNRVRQRRAATRKAFYCRKAVLDVDAGA